MRLIPHTHQCSWYSRYNRWRLRRNRDKAVNAEGATPRWGFPVALSDGGALRSNTDELLLVPRGWRSLDRMGKEDFRRIFVRLGWDYRDDWELPTWFQVFADNLQITLHPKYTV